MSIPVKLARLAVVAATTLVGFAGAVQATPILRSDFAADAVNYGFDGLAAGTLVAGNGDLTVTNGRVVMNGTGPLTSPSYYDGGDASVIRMDFASPVSALGLDFASFLGRPTTLSLFSASNSLLEFLTIPTGSQSLCAVTIAGGVGCGFVGIDYGSSLVAYATIDTPQAGGEELVIDNIIYQRSSVRQGTIPEPGTLALLGMGMAIATRIGRRRTKV